MVLHDIQIPQAAVAEFCERNGIRRLALFGSILTSRFTPASDIDVLVQFEPGRTPGFFGIARLRRELSSMFGCELDLRTPECLSRYFRDDVLSSALVQYVR